MHFKHPLLIITTLLLLLLSLGNVMLSSFAQTNEIDARQTISEAKQEIILCYEAVADAEKAGANTTRLLMALNEAGDLLSRSEAAYKTDSFDSALNLALMSKERLTGIVQEANDLKVSATSDKYTDFLINVAAPIVGTIMLSSCSVIIWLVLEKRYKKPGA